MNLSGGFCAWLRVEETGDGAEFTVRVVPGASADAVCGGGEDVVRVRIAAPPRDGRANRRLVKFLSKTLGVSAGRIEIAAGEKSNMKRIRVSGVEAAAVMEKLAVARRNNPARQRRNQKKSSQ